MEANSLIYSLIIISDLLLRCSDNSDKVWLQKDCYNILSTTSLSVANAKFSVFIDSGVACGPAGPAGRD